MNWNHEINRKEEEEGTHSATIKEDLSHPKKKASNSGVKRRKATKSRRKRLKTGWTKAEKRRYVAFLKKNTYLFNLSSKEKKLLKINVQMSKAIRSRSNQKCHSFHQKMMTRYQSIDKIIQSFSKNDSQRLKSKEQDEMEMMEQIQRSQSDDQVAQYKVPATTHQIIYQDFYQGIIEHKDDHGSKQDPDNQLHILPNDIIPRSASSKELFLIQDQWLKFSNQDH